MAAPNIGATTSTMTTNTLDATSSMDEPSTIATASFPQFAKLPIELRQKIWRHTLTPRVVQIRNKLEFTVEDPKHVNSPLDVLYSTTALPTTFLVCNDSRRAVEPFYPLCFNTSFFMSDIHFNFHLDTLYIDSFFGDEFPTEFFAAFTNPELRSLRYLAVDNSIGRRPQDDPLYGGRYDPTFWEALKETVDKLTNLKCFYLSVDVRDGLVDIGEHFGNIPGIFPRDLNWGYEDDINQVELFDLLPRELIEGSEIVDDHLDVLTDGSYMEYIDLSPVINDDLGDVAPWAIEAGDYDSALWKRRRGGLGEVVWSWHRPGP
ncbi:hypothetical protein LSUE1_G009000, partial [Lachnellula suecica]